MLTLGFFFVCVSYLRIVLGDFDAFVMGDWGGQPSSPYFTKEESATAKLMGDLKTKLDASMVWGLGDNFYDDGVKNEYDKRFKETFEDVFDNSTIENIPFYMIAGNHDHHQNVSGEIYYSNHSNRWRYPNNWYDVRFDVSSDKYLQLLMIDTVLLCGGSDDLEYCQKNNIPISKCKLQPDGTDVNKELAESQWDWINKTLKDSKADYIIVAGHYPIWSIAEHGPTKCLVNELRPMLLQNKVQLYMCGHDHTFEYLQETDYPNLGYVVTGGAHYCDPSTAHKDDVPKNSLKYHDCNDGGFTQLHIDSNGMKVNYYFGGTGDKVRYTTKTFGPRT